MSTPVELPLQPATWYSGTAQDTTPDCPNQGKTFEFGAFYSNGGYPDIVDYYCGKPMTLLTADILDPQPEVS
jgi:hypothetical protein